uniref:Prolyl-ACP dehydrogenase n=1 Tax=Sorangium cellulosum TaxID=56 RepID=F1B9P8_SORCE|nr:prolyl-ACP dehydrogenase [Sorangium cellulosum]
MSSYTRERLDLLGRVRSAAEERMNGELAELDRTETFNLKGWQACADLGVLGYRVPRRYGGQELDVLDTVAALEGLGQGCRDNGLMLAVGAHIWACEVPILAFGTEEQKLEYLPKLASGELVACHAVSEPQAGSDVSSVSTTAVRRGDRYVLNGRKLYVTNAPIAGLCIVFATLDPAAGPRGLTAFLVEPDSAGMAVRKVSKMGLRTAQMGEISLVDCEVPLKNLLGKEREGLDIFNHSMEWERGFILAPAVGSMERVLQRCVRHARSRKQFGAPISSFQAISHKLVDMKLRIETSRSLLHGVAHLKQQGRSALGAAAMAKLHISESWTQVCLDALQIHGAQGYLCENELEREVRDVLGSKIFSGTSEIQRRIIAQLMGL